MPDLDVIFSEGSSKSWKWMISKEENEDFEDDEEETDEFEDE